MKNWARGIDPLDIEEALTAIEESFGIQFVANELADVRSWPQLLDRIEAKLEGIEAEDCTSQQAFYRLRLAFERAAIAEEASLTPSSNLSGLLPRRGRRKTVRKVEETLGQTLDVLGPKNWLVVGLLILLLGSLVALFFVPLPALIGLVAALCAWSLVNRTAIELKVKTLGELAEHMAQQNYRSMRRDPGSINRKEIRPRARALLSERLGLSEKDFEVREAKLA